MANQVMLIVNPTATAYTNVNAAGDDIAAYSAGSVQTNESGLVTLSDAEQATFSAAHTTALMLLFPDVTPTAAEREVQRLASKILRLGKNPGTVTA
jgi:glycine cleavage system protein P-like pyridoxal-binding family